MFTSHARSSREGWSRDAQRTPKENACANSIGRCSRTMLAAINAKLWPTFLFKALPMAQNLPL